MKKILLLLLLPLCGKAQFNFEHEYFGYSNVAHFTNYDTKIIEVDSGDVAWIKLYDVSHNLWKTLTPPQYPGSKAYSASVLSDNLFNSDNLVEYSITYQDLVNGGFYWRVFDENNQMLLNVHNGFSASPIRVDDNDTYKLFVLMWNLNITTGNLSHYTTRVYSLPGTLPCNSCSGLKVNNVQKQSGYISEPIPNPSSGQVVINYFMPAEDKAGELSIYNVNGQQVASYPVVPGGTTITIPTGSLIPGHYYYNLQTQNSVSESKKLVIVK